MTNKNTMSAPWEAIEEIRAELEQGIHAVDDYGFVYARPPIAALACLDRLAEALEAAEEVVRAAELLADLGDWQFVPCEDGSVQIEFHSLGWDMELWIRRFEGAA